MTTRNLLISLNIILHLLAALALVFAGMELERRLPPHRRRANFRSRRRSVWDEEADPFN